MKVQHFQQLLDAQETMLKAILGETDGITEEALNRILKGHSKRFNELLDEALSRLHPNIVDTDDQSVMRASSSTTRHPSNTLATARRPSNIPNTMALKSMTTGNIVAQVSTIPRTATPFNTPKKRPPISIAIPKKRPRESSSRPCDPLGNVFNPKPAQKKQAPTPKNPQPAIGAARKANEIMQSASDDRQSSRVLFPNVTPLKSQSADKEIEESKLVKRSASPEHSPMERGGVAITDTDILFKEAENELARKPKRRFW
ncbi:uncharacterized protein BP5553_02133 [Venustampulla echinocandica]|uniref:Uncharacterized protein n=1 Tax=Venustampulla echinocandica TaxID=2656787 RepID=A0A370U306_9HELO|nr:uncharacterized protein BP5553_02133 [Venustampulla echinocandica]RDL42154.1 hypothetical protein BP5553_02133 [Venustampulla echinocandica]